MTGGGSLLYGLDKIIEQRTGITVTIAEEEEEEEEEETFLKL